MNEWIYSTKTHLHNLYSTYTNCNLSKKGKKKCNTYNVYPFSNISRIKYLIECITAVYVKSVDVVNIQSATTQFTCIFIAGQKKMLEHEIENLNNNLK